MKLFGRRTWFDLVSALAACVGAAVPLSAAADGQPVQPSAAGRWAMVGAYPSMERVGTVSVLPNDGFLVYGVDVMGVRMGQLGILDSLANRDLLRRGGNRDGQRPMVWRADKKAWQGIEPSPECPRDAFLHTATSLADGRVLIAGGLCDDPHPAGESWQPSAHTALSIWNPQTNKWQPAPKLRQVHVFHTSTLLPGAEVLVVGGNGDPLLGPEHAAPSKAVEKFANGVVTPMPDLTFARARHSATGMPNGSLMVIGGLGVQQQTLASVELWDPTQSRWLTLAPLLQARSSHVSTLLADGRVLVAGGDDAQGRDLQTTELFNPATGRWEVGPHLPTEMRAPAMSTTAQGEVLLAGTPAIPSLRPQPRLYIWNPDTPKWRVAGRMQPQSLDLSLDIRQAPSLIQKPDGTVLVFGAKRIFAWTAQSPELAGSAPPWTGRVAATELSDGRVMVVGRVDGTQVWHSHIWNPSTRAWVPSGSLPARKELATDQRIVQLGSGKVILVAMDTNAIAQCTWWSPDAHVWSDCTGTQLEYGPQGRPGMQTIEGRLLAVPNPGEVLRFDEAKLRWELFPLERSTQGLTYGAPIKMQGPLARFLDPQTQQWIDVGDAAAQNGQSISGAAYTVMTATTKKSFSTSNPPALVWDNEKTNWAYVFPYGQMASRAAFLADRCVLSWSPFKLFNPANGRVKQLEIGLEGLDLAHADLVVGKSGAVYLFGPGASGDTGVAITRKADCNGFAADAADDTWMPPRWVTQIPVEAAAAAPLPTSVPEQMKARGYWTTIKDGIQSSQATLLMVAGALVVMELLRRGVTHSARQATNGANSAGKPRTMKTLAHREVPASITWVLRIVLWGVAVSMALPLLFGTVQMVELDTLQTCAAHPITCLSPKTGVLARVDSAPNSPAGEIPVVPCRYVGIWSSRQGAQMNRVSLFENGTYFIDLNPVYNTSTQPYRGYWAVQGSNMIWRHTVGNTGEPDVNPITPGERGSFTLQEMNGSRTLFEPIATLPKTSCQGDKP